MDKKQNQLKAIFFSFALLLQLLVFVSPIQVSADNHNLTQGPIDTTKPPVSSDLPVYNAGVDETIKEYLCTPEGTGTDLFDCINRLYRFGITAGALALVFFVVMAGYLYITGGETAKGKAKSVLFSALTGMGILLGSFLLLSFINPELVKIKPIQPPIFESANLPTCEEVGFGTKCIISTGSGAGQVFNPPGSRGQCTAANLGLCTKWNVNEAIAVCNIESRGYNKAQSGTDLCDNLTGPDGKYL